MTKSTNADDRNDRTIDQTADVKALIGRLRPGEMLQFGQRDVEEYFFARIIGERNGRTKYLEHVWLDPAGVDDLLSMTDGMVKRGELAETDYCSHWKLP